MPDELVLHLGSNLGDREAYLQQAVQSLNDIFGAPLRSSGIFETKAWGNEDQPDFLNCALVYHTSLKPLEVLSRVKRMEVTLGRLSREHWGQREIDIDLIFYGNRILEEGPLQIPHPRMQQRRFVLEPLAEIIPDFIHPVLNKSVKELLEMCEDPLPVKPWTTN